MIKTYTDTACKAASPQYPMLMRGKISGNIFLITGAGRSKAYDAGVVLELGPDGSFGITVGEYSDRWIKDTLEPYTGKITLENQDA